jgi:hypothetical protein
MKQRKLVIGLLIMLAVLASGFTYAFWAGTVQAPVNGTDNRVITIGEGNEVETVLDLSTVTFNSGILVPAGMDNEVGEVDQVSVSFDVFWDNDGLSGASLDDSTTTGTLNYSYVVVVKDDLGAVISDVNVTNLVVVSPAAGNTSITLDDSVETTVAFTITLTEPNSVAEYNAIANGSIEIAFTFTVTGITTN